MSEGKQEKSGGFEPKPKVKFYDCFAVLVSRLPDADNKAYFEVKCFVDTVKGTRGVVSSVQKIDFRIPKGCRVANTEYARCPRSNRPGFVVNFEPVIRDRGAQSLAPYTIS